MNQLTQFVRDWLDLEVRRGLGEFVLPQRCLACGRFGTALHEECVADFARAEYPRCRVCWAPGRSPICERCELDDIADGFDELRTPFRFVGDVRRALLEAKFRGVTALLGPLGRVAAASVERNWRPTVVVPIPLADRRRRHRSVHRSARPTWSVCSAAPA
jgi:predicted amidophosphoribosyltransferase